MALPHLDSPSDRLDSAYASPQQTTVPCDDHEPCRQVNLSPGPSLKKFSYTPIDMSSRSHESSHHGDDQASVRADRIEPAVIFVSIAAVALVGVTCLAVWLRWSHRTVNISTFSGRHFNLRVFAGLLNAGSLIISTLFLHSLSIIGRSWIFRQVRKGSAIQGGTWNAIATRGGFSVLRRGAIVAHGALVAYLVIYWIIGPVISAALTPTLVDVVVRERARVVRISGSLGNEWAWMMADCERTTYSLCPGNVNGSSVYHALIMGFDNVTGYHVGDFRQALSEGFAGQPGMLDPLDSEAISRVVGRLTDVSMISGCVPTIIPEVTCEITRDPIGSSITASTLGTTDACGSGYTLNRGDKAQMADVTGCQIEARDEYRIVYIVAGLGVDQTAPSTETHILRMECVARARETGAYSETRRSQKSGSQSLTKASILRTRIEVHMSYDPAAKTFESQGPCPGGTTVRLTSAELAPLVSSLTLVLGWGFPGSILQPMMAVFQYAMSRSQRDDLERTFRAGMSASAQLIYTSIVTPFMYDRDRGSLAPPTQLPETDAMVRFRAYGWQEGGTSAYVSIGLLVLASILAIAITVYGLTVPRTRYDPADWTRTVLIALNSGSSGAVVTDMEHTRSKEDNLAIRYGANVESRMVFVHSYIERRQRNY